MPRRKTPARLAPKNLVAEVRDAVAHMGWLEASDHALVEQAVMYAYQIEETYTDHRVIVEQMRRILDDPDADAETKVRASESLVRSEAALSKAVGWLGPFLVGALNKLGGDPAARKAVRGGAAVGGRLAHLRAVRSGDAEAVD